MTHKDLDVRNRSVDLVLKIYELTKELPENEKFGLISQIKRSAFQFRQILQKVPVGHRQKNLLDLLT